MVGLNCCCAQSRFSSVLIFFTLPLVVLLPKSDSVPIESVPMLRNHSPRDPNALAEDMQPPLGLDTAGQALPCFPLPSLPASGHPWAVSCNAHRCSQSNIASSAASAAPRSGWGNPRRKLSAHPPEKSCSGPAARSWGHRRWDVHLEKQQKQKCSHRAIRGKSCSLPCLAEGALALRHCFKSSGRQCRGEQQPGWLNTEQEQSHQFFLPLYKSLVGICKGLSYKEVMAPLLYLYKGWP